MPAGTCGLQISLVKYALAEQRNSGSEKYILGYFDAVEIQPITNWLDFSPGKASTSFESRIISRYQIKLLFPQAEVCNTLEQRGCYSSVWENPCDNSFFNENPCVSVILVNLTDQFKRWGTEPFAHWNAYGNVLERFGELIDSLRIKEKLQAAYTCILPSVGYSDYCILLAGKSWDTAFELTQGLHRIKWTTCEENGKGVQRYSQHADAVPLLSTDYMIPVFHAGENVDFDSIPSYSLAAHVNLAPGISMEELAQEFPSITVKQVSGTSDCILEAGPGHQEQLQLLKYLISLNPSSGSKSLFISTRAVLQKELVYNPDSATTQHISNWDRSGESKSGKVTTDESTPDDESTSEKCIDELWRVVERYAAVAKAERRHLRQVQAVKEIIATVKNICKEGHNSSLWLVMQPFLEDFTYDLCTLVQAVENRKGEKEDRLIWFGQIDFALTAFRNYFGSFIADITRSDCFFMETEQYDHASISSATSLILGYNRLINGFSKDVCKLGDSTANLRYSFIVTSGGCDRTETINLFPHLTPEEGKNGITENRLPFLVQMSEMGLFDCGGTVLRLFHECSHYCGDRARKQRLCYVVNFLAKIYGNILAGALLDKKQMADYLKQEFEGILLPDVWKKEQIKICNDIDNVHMECAKKLADRLEAILKQAIVVGLKAEAKNAIEAGTAIKELPDNYDRLDQDFQLAAIAECLGEVNCLGRRLEYSLQKVLFKTFYVYEIDDNNQYSLNQFGINVYSETLIAERDFYAGCYNKLYNISPYSMMCAYERRLRQAQIEKDIISERADPLKSPANKKLERRVTFALQRLVADKFASDNIGKDKSIFEKLPYINLTSQTANAILDMTFEVFGETFADMAACTLLNASLEDYLLAFVFENWDLDESLIVTTDMALRIGAMLHLCFSDQLEGEGLSENAKNQIRTGIQNLERHGMQEGRISADDLIVRIEELLRKYKGMEREAEPLQKYLRECKTKYNDWRDTDVMRRYQNAYAQMRLYRLSGENICEQVTAMVEAVTTGGDNGWQT